MQGQGRNSGRRDTGQRVWGQRVWGKRVWGSLAAAAVLTALAGGCASIKDHRGYMIDTGLLESVQVGVDNRQSVERSLGRPTFVTQWGEQAWYYVSTDTRQRPFARPRAKDQTILRIRFDGKGNVAAIDKAGAEKIAHLDPEGKKTPTLGRNRGFLEDLFGNIGTVGTPGMGGQGGGGKPGGGPNGS